MSSGDGERIISEMDDSFAAEVDSSTPFLWLPDPICDSFANVLGLEYNSSLDLYVLTDDQYADFSDSKHGFTFSLSSLDNQDTLGGALQAPGVVNITVSSAALTTLLKYPYMDEMIAYGDASVPAVPVRRLGGNYTQGVIGRSFLQEAYLITQFDRETFSIHEAVFPNDSLEAVNITQIDQPADSRLPAPASLSSDSGLTRVEMAGIAVGAGAGAVALCIVGLLWYCVRRRKRTSTVPADEKDTASSIEQEEPRTPVRRILSAIGRRRKSKRRDAHVIAAMAPPVEAPNHEVYELPAPVPPAELCADTMAMRKTSQDVSPVQDLSPLTHASDGSSPSAATLPHYMPSPLSPRPDWPGQPDPSPKRAHVPSPIFTAFAKPPAGPGTSPTSDPQSPASSVVPPSPSYQRTPVDPNSRVICLGPIPRNVALPGQSGPLASENVPRILGPDGRSLQKRVSTETLGSNFTEIEERHFEEMGRIDGGVEIVHVPQMADRRYSWEETC